jgi:hypothetical protein
MIERVSSYLKSEYDRRVRRHAFYADLGYGARRVHRRSLSISIGGTRTAADRASINGLKN